MYYFVFIKRMICIFFSKNEEKYCEFDYNKIMKCNTVVNLENQWEDDGLSEGTVTTVKKRLSKHNDPSLFLFLPRKNFKKFRGGGGRRFCASELHRTPKSDFDSNFNGVGVGVAKKKFFGVGVGIEIERKYFSEFESESESESKSVNPLIPIRRTTGPTTDVTSSNRTSKKFSRNDSCAKNLFFKTILDQYVISWGGI
jgi:hypothetical protein